jgi:cytochrome P450
MANILALTADIVDLVTKLAVLSDISGPLIRVGKRSVENYVATYKRDSSRNDLLKRVLTGDKTEKPLTDEEICAEVGSQMIGRTDTTSIALSYTAWELAK